MKTKRSIVLHGPSTLTISLPAKWVRQHNLSKGDELVIKEDGGSLKIYPEEVSYVENKIVVDVDSEEKVGKSSITGAYRQGYDEIEIKFKNKNYIHEIQDLISKQLMGFEIVKQGDNSCIIKDLTGHIKNEFDIVYRRIWLLLLDLAEEVEKKENLSIISIESKDRVINKLCNYCIRHLLKIGTEDRKKTILYYHLIKSIEEIADNYKNMYIESSKNNEKFEKSGSLFISKVNIKLNEFYHIFYNYKKENMEIIFADLKKIINDLNREKNKNSYIQNTAVKLRDLLSALIELNLK